MDSWDELQRGARRAVLRGSQESRSARDASAQQRYQFARYIQGTQLQSTRRPHRLPRERLGHSAREFLGRRGRRR